MARASASATRDARPFARARCGRGVERARCERAARARGAGTTTRAGWAALGAIDGAVTAYAPSAMSAEDGVAQLVVCAFILVVGAVGMRASLESEGEAREAALADKVRSQRTAMARARSSGIEASSSVEDDLKSRGVARVNDVLSASSSAEMLTYVDVALRANDARLDGKNLSMEAFGNVYCKKNRWDLKLSFDPVVRRALGECVRSMSSALVSACGEDATLVELAALVSDPGSTRQPVHPDTAYRSDPSVFTCFVALQDVERDMGPTLFIPGTNNAQAHAEFREGLERGGPVLDRPNELGLISCGDATIFDSRTLHCGTENESSKRRVLFYFSFQRAESDNPNAAISTIRSELRDKYTLGDLLKAA